MDCCRFLLVARAQGNVELIREEGRGFPSKGGLARSLVLSLPHFLRVNFELPRPSAASASARAWHAYLAPNFRYVSPRNAMSQRPRFPLLPLSVHLHAAKRAPPRQGTDFVVPELVHHVKDFKLDKVRTDVKYVVWSFSALIP